MDGAACHGQCAQVVDGQIRSHAWRNLADAINPVAFFLMVIALVGASGVASALLQHADIPWCVAATFSATTILGMLLGRRSIKALAPGHVQRGFSVVLTVVAAGLLWQAIRTLLIA